MRRQSGSCFCLFAMFLVVMVLQAPVVAKTLVVGPNQALKMPSDAAASAADGDTIQIEPSAEKGGYFNCAVWKANHLTIEGKGENVVITDLSCQGKALFVIDGDDVTIRNLTFTRARVPDGNGAGIRAEGGDLRIEHSRFINNENGILSAANPKARITILDSEFTRNGKCASSCAHGIYVGEIALLHVERSIFRETKDAHSIKSRALRTEVIANRIEDGEKGTSSYLVEAPNGGSLILKDNVLEKGPNAGNHSAAVVIGAEGVTHRTEEIVVSGNKFTNDLPMQTIFIRNLTATEAVLTGNSFQGKVTPLSGDGSVR
jgi:hypothetical protein